MSTNEIIDKARLLDEDGNYAGVVDLLEGYIKENPNDRDAMVFYQRSVSLKKLCDSNADIEKLFKNDELRFQGLSDADALKFSDWSFASHVAYVYLKNDTAEKQEASVFGFLEREIRTLGARLHEYSVAKAQLDLFYRSLCNCGYGKYYYKHLCVIIDWQSDTTVNVLKYISENLRRISGVKSNQVIYDEYVENMTENVFPFAQKPDLNGDRATVAGVKTPEQLEFWKGYFARVKEIREEEYAAIQKLTSDENSALNCVEEIHGHMSQSWYRQVASGAITTHDVAKIQVASNCYIGEFSINDYKERVKNAEICFSTIKMDLLARIKADPVGTIKEMIGSIFKKFVK